MSRRASSSSSRPESCEARMSTACSRSAAPRSRASRTRSQTSVAWAASSRHSTSSGARPPGARRAEPCGTRARPAPPRRWRRPAAAGWRGVALERDHRRAREVLGEGQDVLRRGRAKAVDGLQVVAHHRDVGALAAQAADEVHLQPVDVLVLVDEQVVDPGAELRPHDRVLRHCAPVEQQVVEIDDPEPALARAVVDERAARGRRHGARTTGRPRPATRATGAGR